jgi:two-component system chemotaxis response regulator CheB
MTTPARQIRVLVVDDSGISRDLLSHVLSSAPGIEIVGHAHNGEEAVAMLAHLKPDVVTMDIHMPGIDGFEATRRIMETRPLPIVIVSSSFDPTDVAKMFRAMEAGAVAAVEKPRGPGDPRHALLARKVIDTVTAMADVRVIRRWPRARKEAPCAEPMPAPRPGGDVRLVAIGASTGGPPVLQTLLTGLPKPCPVPVVIVQHISAGFVQGLADWLTATTGMPVRLAQHGEIAPAGVALLAPDGCQMSVGNNGRIICGPEPAEHGLRPSASFLFRAVARNFGPHAAGVLLTGMGRDGAEDLKLMRDAGAVTFAQDKESSIVHGMPGEAIRLGAAIHVANPERIAAILHALLAPRATNNQP